MHSNKYFASYYPVNSVIHLLSVFTKLISLFMIILLIALSSSLRLHLVMLFFVIGLLYLSKVPLRFYFDIIYGLRYILIIFVVMLSIKGFELDDALLYLSKITIILMYLSLIFYITSSSELKYGLEKVFSPFNIFNLNISGFINVLVNTITFFPLLLITQREVLINASSRGLDYFHADILSKIIVVIKLIKNTFRLTINKLKLKKIDGTFKLYSTKTFRTNYSTNKFGIRDISILVVFIIFFYYHLLESGLL